MRGNETVLITGGAGYLGRALRAAAPTGARVHWTTRAATAAEHGAHRLELGEAEPVAALFERVRPDLVIHTAYSLRDPERDIEAATRNVCDAAADAGAALIHLSTDMLLDGENAPYDERAEPAPVLDYGRWKERAERYVRERMPAADLVRTSLLTGFDPLDPRSAWVAGGLRGEESVTLYADEIRSPILVEDVAAQIWEIAALDPSRRGGVWNLAGPEALSRYALGLLVAAALGLPADRLGAASTRDAPSPRPRDLRLSTARADAELSTRARPVSAAAAGVAAARSK